MSRLKVADGGGGCRAEISIRGFTAEKATLSAVTAGSRGAANARKLATGGDPMELEARYEYRRENDRKLYCDVYSKDYESGEMKLEQTYTYLFDEKGRVAEEWLPEPGLRHSYK